MPKSKKLKPNPSLLNKIGVQGGVSFKHDKFISTGTGYTCCLHVYEFPRNVDILWLTSLTEQADSITTIDVFTPDREISIKKVTGNIKEQEIRSLTDRDQNERNKAEDEKQQMEQLLDEINNDGEVLKLVHARLFLTADTPKLLEIKYSSLIKHLESKNFRTAVFLNQTESEFKSLSQSYSKNIQSDIDDEALPIQAYTLASGLPFNFSQLKDPHGFYLGETPTNGVVLFNQFHKDLERLSYETLILGKKGAGKSTLIKLLLLHHSIKGNFTRILDPSDEFTALTLALGGTIINLDGSDGIQNILEINHTHREDPEKYKAESADCNEYEQKQIQAKIKTIEQKTSFQKNLNKVKVFYSVLSGTNDKSTLALFETMIKKLYDNFGLDPDKIDVTGLNPDRYPILSDLLDVVHAEVFDDIQTKKIKPDLSKLRADMLEQIAIVLESIIENHGSMFNGYSTIENFFDQPLITFNIKGLKNFSSNVYNAQMYNICNLLWENMIQNGDRMKRMFEDGHIDNKDVIYYNIVVDEAHRVINSNNPLLLDFFIDYSKEARKYFAGISLAFHNIRDVVPENSTAENIDKIKILFELIQYKFLMKQDSNSIDSLLNVFQNSLTYEEVKMIPSFQQGEAILIGAGNNIKFDVDVSQDEISLFKGGV